MIIKFGYRILVSTLYLYLGMADRTVNLKAELDAYLNQNWSLEQEKVYENLGRVPTQNYVDGVNSPVNGLIMSGSVNNRAVIGVKNDNNVRAEAQSGHKMLMLLLKYWLKVE